MADVVPEAPPATDSIAPTRDTETETAPPAAPPDDAEPEAPPDKRVLNEGMRGGALASAWSEVQSDLKRRAWAEAMGRLPHLVEMRNDLGYPNLEPMSAVLLHAAREAAADGSLEGAFTLANAAATLSPSMAAPHAATAAYSFERSPFALTPQLQGLRSAVEQLTRDLPAGLSAYGNGLMAASLVLLVLLGLYGLAMLLRYRLLIASDIQRLLPRGVSGLHAMVLLLAVATAPILAGLGLLVASVLWLVISAPYQRVMERVFTGALLLGLTAFPTIADHVVRAIHYPMTPDATIARCLKGPCALDDRERLKAWSETGVLPYETNFTLATLSLRDAGTSLERLKETVAYAEKMLEVDPTVAAHTLLGNIVYRSSLNHCPETGTVAAGSLPAMKAEQAQALALWREAFRRDPNAIAPLYNAHAVLRQMAEHDMAEAVQAKLLALDTWGVVAWNKEVAKESNTLPCRMLDHPNRHLMPPATQTRRLFANVVSYPVSHDGLIVPWPGLVAGRSGGAVMGLAGPIGILAMALCWLMAVLIRPSRICRSCEGVALPNTSLEVPDGMICEACLLQEMRKGTTDAKGQWKKERDREGDNRLRRLRTRLVTWGMPGFGHLLRGAPLRGLLLMGTFISAVVLLSGVHIVVLDPRVPSGDAAGLTLALTSLTALTWLAAVLDVHTGRVGR